jgi:ferredoxin
VSSPNLVTVTVEEAACRGCRMCVDICPTKVLEFDEKEHKAVVRVTEDCIGCLSCGYLCPSGAVHHEGYRSVRNFYRDLEFEGRMRRYL